MAATTDLSTLRAIQTLGITSTLVLSGASISLSSFVIPRILEAPTVLCLKQWDAMFTQGKKTIPPAAVLTSGTWFYLAWNSFKTAGVLGESAVGKMRMYALAGALCAGILPYTIVFLVGASYIRAP